MKKHLTLIKHTPECFRRPAAPPCVPVWAVSSASLPKELSVPGSITEESLWPHRHDGAAELVLAFQSPTCPCRHEVVKPCFPDTLPGIGDPMSCGRHLGTECHQWTVLN